MKLRIWALIHSHISLLYFIKDIQRLPESFESWLVTEHVTFIFTFWPVSLSVPKILAFFRPSNGKKKKMNSNFIEQHFLMYIYNFPKINPSPFSAGSELVQMSNLQANPSPNQACFSCCVTSTRTFLNAAHMQDLQLIKGNHSRCKYIVVNVAVLWNSHLLLLL